MVSDFGICSKDSAMVDLVTLALPILPISATWNVCVFISRFNLASASVRVRESQLLRTLSILDEASRARYSYRDGNVEKQTARSSFFGSTKPNDKNADDTNPYRDRLGMSFPPFPSFLPSDRRTRSFPRKWKIIRDRVPRLSPTNTFERATSTDAENRRRFRLCNEIKNTESYRQEIVQSRDRVVTTKRPGSTEIDRLVQSIRLHGKGNFPRAADKRARARALARVFIRR